MQRPDLELMLQVREPMLEQFSLLPNVFGMMQERTADVEDWETFTYATAGAWGLAADQHAMYATYTPEDGWRLMLRAYRPRVEEFMNYEMPPLTRLD